MLTLTHVLMMCSPALNQTCVRILYVLVLLFKYKYSILIIKTCVR